MSLKLFILVAALTVMATQAIKPIPGSNLRFRGGISTGSGSDKSRGKVCKKYNPPARFRKTLKDPNMAFFKKNCESVPECEWSDDMCGAKATLPPAPKTPPTPPEPTEEQCRLANAGPGATSAEAQQLCGAANCKYFVKTKTNFRCCHHPKADKITFCDTKPSTGGITDFPKPDAAVKEGGKCDDTCCSDAAKIDHDQAKSELGGGKCKVDANNKCKHTDDNDPCPSQMAVGTKCKLKPPCK